jgi:hypothetical protein
VDNNRPVHEQSMKYFIWGTSSVRDSFVGDSSVRDSLVRDGAIFYQLQGMGWGGGSSGASWCHHCKTRYFQNLKVCGSTNNLRINVSRDTHMSLARVPRGSTYRGMPRNCVQKYIRTGGLRN